MLLVLGIHFAQTRSVVFMMHLALALLLFGTPACFAANKAVRKVTIFPISQYMSISHNPERGVAAVGASAYNTLYTMKVAVSDDPGKIYSISCFEYHIWNHCELPKGDSYDAEIRSNVIRIIAKRNRKGKAVMRAKYRTDYVTPPEPRP